MTITSRRKAMVVFTLLGAGSLALAIALNVSWIILHWRQAGAMILGIILFALLIAGIVLNTIFLMREIKRNEQHDSFINAVTHELKTPVASIRLYLQTLETRELTPEKRREFYRVMLEDTDRLQRTIEQVLKAGEVVQRHERHAVLVDMHVLVNECVSLARTRHNLTEEQMQAHHYAESATVVGVADELRTAITNLLDNAVKYSREHIHINVDLLADEQNVLVRVRDEGVGIARGELKRIFRRFYRATSRATTRKISGTGLGLFIVRSIAKKHGGRSFAESEGEGRGTTVTLELPKATA